MIEQNTNKLLSEVITHMKYSRYLPDKQRRENWNEIVDRNKQMHQDKFPELTAELEQVYKDVYNKNVLPSMRSLQHAGISVQQSNVRLFNCSYAPIQDIKVFSEIFYNLLAGCGVGFSVQSQHVNQLPIFVPFLKLSEVYTYQVADTIEGWADSLNELLECYFSTGNLVQFDYSLIRPKGSPLITSGGIAPGSEPLKNLLNKLRFLLDEAKETQSKLTPFQCHRIVCLTADAVLSGGNRRSALISLFDKKDREMLECKKGEWWIKYSELGRSNNSAVLLRGVDTDEDFNKIWKISKDSNAGEPGFYWTNDKNIGTNPCCEISLLPYSFCNLIEINGDFIESEDMFLRICKHAAYIGTLQASYTDFPYLRPIWKLTSQEDALIGVGITGLASNKIKPEWLTKGAEVIKEENLRISRLIGINTAARQTTLKPSGTSSLVLGTSSGIHTWYDKYYIRRVRVNKQEPIYTYLSIKFPELLEDDVFSADTTSVISFPIKAPEGAITRNDENAVEFLERIKTVYKHWIKLGHLRGKNTNNISATVNLDEEKYYNYKADKLTKEIESNVKLFKYLDNQELLQKSLNDLQHLEYTVENYDEWENARMWLLENKDFYNGISVLPYDNGSYQQAPYETISREKYEELISKTDFSKFNVDDIIELQSHIDLNSESACSGNQCDVF